MFRNKSKAMHQKRITQHLMGGGVPFLHEVTGHEMIVDQDLQKARHPYEYLTKSGFMQDDPSLVRPQLLDIRDNIQPENQKTMDRVPRSIESYTSRHTHLKILQMTREISLDSIIPLFLVGLDQLLFLTNMGLARMKGVQFPGPDGAFHPPLPLPHIDQGLNLSTPLLWDGSIPSSFLANGYSMGVQEGSWGMPGETPKDIRTLTCNNLTPSTMMMLQPPTTMPPAITAGKTDGFRSRSSLQEQELLAVRNSEKRKLMISAFLDFKHITRTSTSGTTAIRQAQRQEEQEAGEQGVFQREGGAGEDTEETTNVEPEEAQYAGFYPAGSSVEFHDEEVYVILKDDKTWGRVTKVREGQQIYDLTHPIAVFSADMLLRGGFGLTHDAERAQKLRDLLTDNLHEYNGLRSFTHQGEHETQEHRMPSQEALTSARDVRLLQSPMETPMRWDGGGVGGGVGDDEGEEEKASLSAYPGLSPSAAKGLRKDLGPEASVQVGASAMPSILSSPQRPFGSPRGPQSLRSTPASSSSSSSLASAKDPSASFLMPHFQPDPDTPGPRRRAGGAAQRRQQAAMMAAGGSGGAADPSLTAAVAAHVTAAGGDGLVSGDGSGVGAGVGAGAGAGAGGPGGPGGPEGSGDPGRATRDMEVTPYPTVKGMTMMTAKEDVNSVNPSHPPSLMYSQMTTGRVGPSMDPMSEKPLNILGQGSFGGGEYDVGNTMSNAQADSIQSQFGGGIVPQRKSHLTDIIEDLEHQPDLVELEQAVLSGKSTDSMMLGQQFGQGNTKRMRLHTVAPPGTFTMPSSALDFNTPEMTTHKTWEGELKSGHNFRLDGGELEGGYIPELIPGRNVRFQYNQEPQAVIAVVPTKRQEKSFGKVSQDDYAKYGNPSQFGLEHGGHYGQGGETANLSGDAELTLILASMGERLQMDGWIWAGAGINKRISAGKSPFAVTRAVQDIIRCLKNVKYVKELLPHASMQQDRIFETALQIFEREAINGFEEFSRICFSHPPELVYFICSMMEKSMIWIGGIQSQINLLSSESIEAFGGYDEWRQALNGLVESQNYNPILVLTSVHALHEQLLHKCSQTIQGIMTQMAEAEDSDQMIQLDAGVANVLHRKEYFMARMAEYQDLEPLLLQMHRSRGSGKNARVVAEALGSGYRTFATRIAHGRLRAAGAICTELLALDSARVEGNSGMALHNLAPRASLKSSMSGYGLKLTSVSRMSQQQLQKTHGGLAPSMLLSESPSPWSAHSVYQKGTMH